MLVIVLDNDARSLEHVPRVVNPTPQVRLLPTPALGRGLILHDSVRVIATSRRRTPLLFLSTGCQVALLTPTRIFVLQQRIALAANTVTELGWRAWIDARRLLQTQIYDYGCDLRV